MVQIICLYFISLWTRLVFCWTTWALKRIWMVRKALILDFSAVLFAMCSWFVCILNFIIYNIFYVKHSLLSLFGNLQNILVILFIYTEIYLDILLIQKFDPNLTNDKKKLFVHKFYSFRFSTHPEIWSIFNKWPLKIIMF